MYNWKLGTQPATEGRTAGSAGRNGFQAANHVVFQGKWHGQQQEERAIPVEEEGQSWERTDRERERSGEETVSNQRRPFNNFTDTPK